MSDTYNLQFNPSDEEIELIKDRAKSYWKESFTSYHEAYEYFYEREENSFYSSY